MIILAYIFIVVVLILLLYDYRTGIITSLMVITNFGEFIYLNPNLVLGDFGGAGTIYFMDLFWISLVMVIILKRKNLSLFKYQLSFLILLFLCLISCIIPFLISSFSIKDSISVIRPLGNFLFLPYFVITITDLKGFNFFEKIILGLTFIFISVQLYEYIMQQRIPLRLLEEYSMFFAENPFSVEFAGIKTGYIWSRIGYLLPFNLFFGCYYYFTSKKIFGLFLIAVYILSIMLALSRIWIIGMGFFLLVITIFLIFKKYNENNIRLKFFSLVGSFAVLGFVLLLSSETFTKIFDIFLLRINSINDLADKTDSSFLGREYILLQMMNVWYEYPVFGTGFSTISRRLITNDLGLPNIITIFGAGGLFMFFIFMKQFYDNIKPFIKNYYILFVSLFSIMLMITFMSALSIDMFYFNATGAILFALANIILNIGEQDDDRAELDYNT